jgi:hypothetical protein
MAVDGVGMEVGGKSTLANLLRQIVKTYLDPSNAPDKTGLGRELIGLLEALCWYVPDEVAGE